MIAIALETPDDDRNMPLHWREEDNPPLHAAVRRYLRGEGMGAIDVVMVMQYLRRWIDADAWKLDPEKYPKCLKEMLRLQIEVSRIRNAPDIARWAREAMDIGIDPL